MRHFDNTHIKVIEVAGNKPRWFGTLLRVIAIATLIIPALMLLGALIYRIKNRFCVVSAPNRLNSIPDEILKLIAKQCGPASLQLGATNQTTKRLLENEPVLKEHRLILDTLKKHYKKRNVGVGPVYFKTRTLCHIAKALIPINPKKALEIALEAVENTSNMSRDNSLLFLNTIATLNQEKGLELAKTLFDYANASPNDVSIFIFEKIAKFLVPFDQDKAVIAATQAISRRNTLENISLNNIAKTISKCDVSHANLIVDRVLTKMEGLNASSRVDTLTLLAEHLSKVDPSRATELIKQAILEAKVDGSALLKAKAYTAYVKILLLENPEKALEKTDKAHNTADAIADNSKRTEALTNLSKVLSSNAPRALDLTRSVLRAFDCEPLDETKANILDNIIPTIVCLPEQERIEMIDLAYNTVKDMGESKHKSQALAALALATAEVDPEQAVNWVKQAIIGANTHFINVAKVINGLSKEHALEVAEEAFAAANSMQVSFERNLALREISIALASKDLKRALEEVEECEGVYYLNNVYMEIVLRYLSQR